MPVRSNLTFVAQWWPVVTFDANGGAWSSVETMRYAKIQTDTKKVAAASTPVRNGYTFLGWYTAADDGDRANFEDTVNRPTTLYAHWAKNAAVTFRIVNGTWSGGAAEDKTVTVVLYPQADGTASGTLDASYVPQIMLPGAGIRKYRRRLGTDAEHRPERHYRRCDLCLPVRQHRRRQLFRPLDPVHPAL